MKRVYFLLLPVFFIFSNTAFSQQDLPKQAFQKGDVLLNAGLSIGVFNFGLGARHPSGFPLPLTANLEWGISDVIGVGPYAGFLFQGYDTPTGRYSRSTYALGGQLAFHLTPFLNEQLDLSLEEELIDIYLKANIGYEWYMEQQNGIRLPREFLSPPDRIVFGPVIGLRYMINPSLGAYAEGGRGTFGWVSLGISLKL